MRSVSKYLMLVLVCGFSFLQLAAQCPQRPPLASVVQDPLALASTNGTLTAELTMRRTVDTGGYTHYCYNYATANGDIEAPTFRLNPGDTLQLGVKNRIVSDGKETSKERALMQMMLKHHMPETPVADICGDTGAMTIDSTNVHYHGMNVPPTCHSDEVVKTLIQPGTDGFRYQIHVPANEPPGLYWYHPHVHGFTEYQVNGGAAGAIVVEGMEKVHPEVTGLTERVLILRQQFLVPWIPGPYQLTLNYVVAAAPTFPSPVMQMKPGEKQFWRVANATNQDFMPLQVQFDGVPQQLQLIALDGYPVTGTRFTDTILLPPAGRAEFIVQAPPDGNTFATFQTLDYSTGPTGNPDAAQILANIQVGTGSDTKFTKTPLSNVAANRAIKFSGLKSAAVTANRDLYFSEEFGGTGGPIQFYLTVKGQKQQIFDPEEKPVIVTKVGAVEDWVVENHALETHAFHIHQIHFLLMEVDGKPVTNQDLRDTIEIPFWEGPGHPYHSVKMRMDFRDPETAGTSLIHCHILLHEDLGMMHKILVMP